MRTLTCLLFMLLLPAIGLAQRDELNERDFKVVDAVTGLPVRAHFQSSFYLGNRLPAPRNGREYDSHFEYQFFAPGYVSQIVREYQIGKAVPHVVSLRPLETVLTETVVVASRQYEYSKRVPQVVRTIAARELTTAAPATTADALAQTGEVFVQQSQMGGGSPVLRGFEANKVLLTVDGIRLNNLIYRGAHLQNVITLDPAILDRAEVAMGTGSAAYGSDALGGVVALFTRSPLLIEMDDVEEAAHADTARFGGTAFTRYATANHGQTAHLTLDYGRKKVGVLSSVTLSRFSDLRVGATGRKADWDNWGLRPVYQTRQGEADVAVDNPNPVVQRGSGYDQADALLKVVYQPRRAWHHTLNLQGSTSTDVPRTDRLSEIRNGQPRFAEWTYGPQRRGLAAWQVEHAPVSENRRFSNRLNLSVAAQHVEESRHDRRWQAPRLNNRFERVSAFSVNADFIRRLHWDFKENVTFCYGTELLYQTVRSTAYTTPAGSGRTAADRQPLDTRYPDGGASVRTGAVYVTVERPRGSLTQSAGVRVTTQTLHATFRDRTFFPFPFERVRQRQTALTGHTGLTWQGPHGWWLAARAAAGFRAPNVDDLAKVFESVPGALVVPNPRLRPERTWSAELTVRRQAAGWLDARLTGYHTWYRNALGLAPGQFNGADRCCTTVC